MSKIAKKDRAAAYAPIPKKKRTSIGSGTPLNKSKRRNWKPYRGQGRP